MNQRLCVLFNSFHTKIPSQLIGVAATSAGHIWLWSAEVRSRKLPKTKWVLGLKKKNHNKMISTLLKGRIVSRPNGGLKDRCTDNFSCWIMLKLDIDIRHISSYLYFSSLLDQPLWAPVVSFLIIKTAEKLIIQSIMNRKTEQELNVQFRLRESFSIWIWLQSSINFWGERKKI